MNLRPEDVEQVKFRVALRGYAEDEVDIFLDQVADTIRDLNRKLAAAERETQELREREALRIQRELMEAPPLPVTPPLLPEEQPPLPVMPAPAPDPPVAEGGGGEGNAERVEDYDLPTQVIEPEQREGEQPPPPPPDPEDSPADRPQWGGYSY